MKPKRRSKVREAEAYAEAVKVREFWQKKCDLARTLDECDMAMENFIEACNKTADFV